MRQPGRGLGALAVARALATCAALAVTPGGRGDGIAALHARGDAWAAARCDGVRFKRMSHGGHRAFFMPEDSVYLGGHAFMHEWFHTRELAMADVYEHVLGGGRPGAATPATHFHVDVGCNAGWYTATAAVHGFATLAVDMQPECARLTRCAGVANGAAVDARFGFVSDDAGAAALPTTVRDCVLGVVPGWEAHGEIVQAGPPALAPPVDLGRALRDRCAATGHRVALLKVDIDGSEPVALASLAAAGALHLIDHIVAEVTPKLWLRQGHDPAAGYGALAQLFASGFVAAYLPERNGVPARSKAGLTVYANADAFEAHLRAVTAEEVAAIAGPGVGTIRDYWFYRPAEEAPVDAAAVAVLAAWAAAPRPADGDGASARARPPPPSSGAPWPPPATDGAAVPPPPPPSAFPHVIYVNLDHRTDRRAEVERQLAAAGWPAHRVHRLSATANATHGMVGCNWSHLRAVRHAIAAGWPAVAIVEDDVVFRDPAGVPAVLAAWAAWTEAARRPWDVVLLSGIRRELAPEPVVAPPPARVPGRAPGDAPLVVAPPPLRRARNTQTTAGYLVSQRYLPTLEANFAEAAAALAARPDLHARFSADQHWKALQDADEWLHFEPMLADQGAGHSDIVGAAVDHAAAFAAYEAVRRAAEAGESLPTAWDASYQPYK